MTTGFLLLVLGFVILIKGADWLVNGSVSLAKHYKISELAIGLTIVAFGTSAPELVVNIISSLKGLNDVTMGNIVGSNLFNLMLILGLSGIIFPLVVQVKTIWNEIPFSLLAAFVLLILGNFTFNHTNQLSINRLDGFILLLFFTMFMLYIFVNLRKKEETLDVDYKMIKPMWSVFLILIGLASLVIGSQLVVDNAVKIAQFFGASEKLIGITIVSAGTSLPELVTSVVAATRKKSDIAIGNIIGSNIFNIFLILGVSSIISPIHYNISFNLDILILIVSTILLFVFMFSGKKYKLDRWESALLLIGYIGYIYYLLR
ncbi:MAG: calcium/sodium antiporter [Bacteroidales bacterium]|nr:calcium/sodium antiporter [Bacteroidales bacterium]MBN2818183.1 calcium/sodium antiporter [Bacteroidales bacterium]